MGYNPTTNDPFRHNRNARRRRDRRIDNSLTAAGTQPFRAVDKIGSQIDLITVLQEAISDVLDRIPTVTARKTTASNISAAHTTWTTIATLQISKTITSMTKVAVNAVGQAVFNQTLTNATTSDKATAATTKVYVRVLIGGTVVNTIEAAKTGSGDSYTYVATVDGMHEISGVGNTTTISLQIQATSIIGFSSEDSAQLNVFATYSA